MGNIYCYLLCFLKLWKLFFFYVSITSIFLKSNPEYLGGGGGGVSFVAMLEETVNSDCCLIVLRAAGRVT